MKNSVAYRAVIAEGLTDAEARAEAATIERERPVCADCGADWVPAPSGVCSVCSNASHVVLKSRED